MKCHICQHGVPSHMYLTHCFLRSSFSDFLRPFKWEIPSRRSKTELSPSLSCDLNLTTHSIPFLSLSLPLPVFLLLPFQSHFSSSSPMLTSCLSFLPAPSRFSRSPSLPLLLFRPVLLFLLQNCQITLVHFTLFACGNNSHEPRRTARFSCSS